MRLFLLRTDTERWLDVLLYCSRYWTFITTMGWCCPFINTSTSRSPRPSRCFPLKRFVPACVKGTRRKWVIRFVVRSKGISPNVWQNVESTLYYSGWQISCKCPYTTGFLQVSFQVSGVQVAGYRYLTSISGLAKQEPQRDPPTGAKGRINRTYREWPKTPVTTEPPDAKEEVEIHIPTMLQSTVVMGLLSSNSLASGSSVVTGIVGNSW